MGWLLLMQPPVLHHRLTTQYTSACFVCFMLRLKSLAVGTLIFAYF